MPDKPIPPDDNPNEFRFNLGEAYQYDRFPMKRLSAYLQEIIGMFGDEENIYFLRLEKGSAVAVVRTEPDNFPILEDGLRAVLRGDAPPGQIAYFRRFTKMLEEDALAHDAPILEPAKIIQFPGTYEAESEGAIAPDFGWFTEYEQIDGIPIEVGGGLKMDKKHVKLKTREGREYMIYTDEEMANEIKLYLWHTTLRVDGIADWKRDPESGKWKMKDFRASGYRVLPERSLEEDIAALREYPAKWKELEDPLRELDIIRHEDDIQ